MTERLSASVVSRHLACHGSANLDQAILGWQPPIEDRTISNAANDGTRLHEILEPIMELTPARLRQMAKVVQYIADLRSSRRFTTVLIEQSFTAHWLLGKPDTKPDLVLATQDEIHIVDFKWGKILVEAKGNTQGLYYAACAAGLAPRAKGVTIHILQPAIDNMDSWFADTDTIGVFMDDVQQAELAIRAGDLTLSPSDACTFCPANPHSRGRKGSPFCPAMMTMLYPSVVDDDAILDL
jgi:hypothetical protein